MVGNKKLLVWVDDSIDQDSIDLLYRPACERHEFELIAAYDGQDALEKIEALPADRKPDAVITDVSMPRMDGLELTRTLRKKGYTMPILVSSSNYAKEKLAKEAGADSFIFQTGNLSRDVYLQTIKTLIKRQEDRTPSKPIEHAQRPPGNASYGGAGGAL